MDSIQLMRNFGLRIGAVIHVGANTGQERFAYHDAGAETVLLIEPTANVFQQLRKNIVGFKGFVTKRALCSDVDGEIVDFNVANNGGQSSSMFELGALGSIYPEVGYTHQEEITTSKLDSIVEGGFPKWTMFHLCCARTVFASSG